MTHVLFLEVKVGNSVSNTRVVTKWPITYSAAIPLLRIFLAEKSVDLQALQKLAER